ncbi:hypothetical protein G7Y89_g6847 [Cudoniella acicularis]|uniref:Uncharacterized protein n=1 Tax=Cudoniella acicularis TaxID=354080 RepID=A0A8H4W2M6_9HELO|nr:hypothetical protein G7Y89_g6847 [Cudoniella acicularis]
MVGADAHELKKQLLEIPLRDLDRNECSASCVRDSMEVGRGAATEVDEDGRETHLSSIKLLCLTISLGGLQTIWTAIMSQGSPYLASLGMNPSLISLVWLAGPLSGIPPPSLVHALNSLKRLSFRRPQFNLPKLTVRRAWIISQTLASTAFFCIGLTKNCILSTIIISILGVSWALTQWAPFALIGAELAKSRSPPAISVEETQPIYTAIPAGTDNDDGDEPSLHLNSNADEDLEHHPSPIEPTIVQAGSVMGVHNMAISMPQIVAAAGSSALFGILSRWRVDGVDAMGLLFMMGVFPAGIAAWLAVGIEDD